MDRHLSRVCPNHLKCMIFLVTANWRCSPVRSAHALTPFLSHNFKEGARLGVRESPSFSLIRLGP
jgi:hypothetical protein